MDKLKAIRSFVAIADAGSFTAAATALATSLPSVVRQLAALEALLGARLFNRSTRHVALTEQGRLYLLHARSLLAADAEADAQLQADQSEPQGRLVITAPVLFGQRYLCPAINRFIEHYPKLSVEVHLLDRLVNLVEEGFDLGLRIGEMHDSSLVGQHLADLRRVYAAAPTYLASSGTPTTPAALREHNCLRSTQQQGHWMFQQQGKNMPQGVSGRLVFNQVAPLVEACVAGLGIGHFSIYQVAPYLQSGQLQLVLEDYELAARPLHILYPHSKLLAARSKALIAWIKQEISEVQATWE
ncbi:LysR family transcriptional regulator [Undibacterium sp.]|uniref:LysR family transcriptional regulator n=1 Tax=Undibacterium sp. TaxID=1914977 RepID=UPI0025CCBF7F|nr:LysR family transcriptional regulator [Undibacterium sp.]